MFYQNKESEEIMKCPTTFIAVAFTSVKNDKMELVCHRDTRESAEERFREIAKKRKRKFLDAFIYKVEEEFHIENANYITCGEVLKMK